MGYTCPSCSSSDTETTEDGRGYCEDCRQVFTPQLDRLPIDPPERVRKDTDS